MEDRCAAVRQRKPYTKLLGGLFGGLLGLSLLLGGGCAGKIDAKVRKEAELHYKLGANHFNNNEVPQAIRELDAALKSAPEHPRALHLMGLVYMGRREYVKSMTYFKKAIKAKPDFYNCLNNLGVVYLYTERWEEAAKIFDKLSTTTLYTSPWLAYSNLGWAYYQLGRVDEGIEQTEKALFLNPEMCLASNNLGMMLEHRTTTLKKSKRAFKDAIDQCPAYAEPHLHLGRLLAEEGDVRAANKLFRKCISLSPRSHIGERCEQYELSLR